MSSATSKYLESWHSLLSYSNPNPVLTTKEDLDPLTPSVRSNSGESIDATEAWEYEANLRKLAEDRLQRLSVEHAVLLRELERYRVKESQDEQHPKPLELFEHRNDYYRSYMNISSRCSTEAESTQISTFRADKVNEETSLSLPTAKVLKAMATNPNPHRSRDSTSIRQETEHQVQVRHWKQSCQVLRTRLYLAGVTHQLTREQLLMQAEDACSLTAALKNVNKTLCTTVDAWKRRSTLQAVEIKRLQILVKSQRKELQCHVLTPAAAMTTNPNAVIASGAVRSRGEDTTTMRLLSHKARKRWEMEWISQKIQVKLEQAEQERDAFKAALQEMYKACTADSKERCYGQLC